MRKETFKTRWHVYALPIKVTFDNKGTTVPSSYIREAKLDIYLNKIIKNKLF